MNINKFNINNIKQYAQRVWSNRKRRYIIIGVLIILILLILIIIIAVSVSGSDYVKPNCKGICEKPYNIKVYSDKKLKSQLKKCKYKKDSDLFNFVLAAIKKHNIYRACHNAQPLLPNCEIMEISQKYAETMPSSHSGAEFHGDWMGENLYWITGKKPNGEDAVDAWYNEIVDYDFNSHTSKGGKVGHFTQLIWKNSKEIGVGYYCNNEKCCVSANYFPGGNYNNDNANQVQNLQ